MKRLCSAFFFALLLTLTLADAAQQPPTAGPGTPGSAMSPASAAAQAPAAKPADAAPAQSAAKPEAKPPAEPTQPTTVMQPTTNVLDKGAKEGPDLLLDPPSLPNEKPTLIGGTVRRIDRLRNRLQVQVFGGKKLNVNFDNRTRILRNGVAAQPSAIKTGERIYLDTMLNEGEVFAKNIHIQTEVASADVEGQLVGYSASDSQLVLRDKLSNSEVPFRLAADAVIRRPDGAGTASDLRPGALVAVRFSPGKRDRGLVREVTIIAMPGSTFTFHGRLTHLDISGGVLAIENQTDQKIYTISFDSSRTQVNEHWQVGAEATIVASFDGPRYTAQSVSIVRPPGNESN